jgi:hypothetical protein
MMFDPRGRCGEPALAATHVGTGAPTHRPRATDIVDRGYQHFDHTLNFLLCERALGNNIVTNPTRAPRDPRDRADPFPSPRGRPPRRSVARVTVITMWEINHDYECTSASV